MDRARDAAPGDIAIFNWDGGAPDHIGIVEEYLGGGKFNVARGQHRRRQRLNGGRSCAVGALSQVDGFGRVR